MSVITIDAEGDTIIDLEAGSLLVSSRILSEASLIFKARLENTSRRLYLGKWNLEAVTIFCRVIHRQEDRIPPDPDTSCLCNLARFCLSYQCSPSLASYGSRWFQRDMCKSSIGELAHLLLLAYSLDYPESFSLISWRIILLLQDDSIANCPVLGEEPFTDLKVFGE